MSVILNGELQQIECLVRFLHNFKALCAKEEPEQNVELNALTIENKYYSAKLALQAVGFGSNEDTSIFDNAEGYVLVPDASDSDLSLAKYYLSKAAIEADTGLRLLVTLVAGGEAAHGKAHEEWALENGFEYIEIDTTDPTKDHQEREKYGLPRLVEALESNMWSTMQRAPRSTPSSSSSFSSSSSSSAGVGADAGTSSSASIDEAVNAVSSQGTYTPPALPVPPATTTTSVPPAVAADPPSVPGSAASTATMEEEEKEEKARVDPFEVEMEDKEDNEIVDKYADFISEVKSFREQATAGQIPDQARRDQAAEMVLKLAQMMGFDESDSDDSS